MSNTTLIFSNKRHDLHKKRFIEKKIFFFADYVKINELHVVHTRSHAILVDEIMGVIISIQKVTKNLKHFEKIVFLNKFSIIFHSLSNCVFILIQNIGWNIPLKIYSTKLMKLSRVHVSSRDFSVHPTVDKS